MSAAAEPAATAVPSGVMVHGLFFDHLVELVPVKYYYDDGEKVNPRFLAKAAREAAKQQVGDGTVGAGLHFDGWTCTQHHHVCQMRCVASTQTNEARLASIPRATACIPHTVERAVGGLLVNLMGAISPALSPFLRLLTLCVQMKDQYKVNKKAKFDPSVPRTILEVQQHKVQTAGQGAQQQAGSSAAGDGPSTSQPAQQGLALKLSGTPTKREELLARLHAKVEEQRKAREAKAGAAQQAKEWRNNALQTNAKHKQQQQQLAGSKRKAEEQVQPAQGKGQQGGAKQQQQQQHGGQQGAKQQPAGAGGKAGAGSAAGDFTFARIDGLDDESRRGAGKHGKRPPKEVLLKQVEAQKSQLEALAGTSEGKVLATNLAWKAALGRAKGEKVLDDPKLLRKSLKKDAKRKEKSSAAWRDRVNVQTEVQQARQDKRTGNLQVRAGKGREEGQWRRA